MATCQPLAHRKVFIKDREAYELARVLRNSDQVSQRVLLDIDGTLHRGLHWGAYEGFLRGVTNADLAWSLLWKIPLAQKPRFFYDCLKIFLYDRKTLANGVPDEERELHSRYLVDLFFLSLEAVPESLISDVASSLPKRMYPHVEETLEQIGGRKALISCGLQAVVDAYGKHLGIREGYGNPFPPCETQYGKVYGAEDKERIARMICLSSKAERLIIAGDTTDDVGMAKVAHEVNPESVVLALHNRSEALEDRADIIAYSWRDLRAFLEEY